MLSTGRLLLVLPLFLVLMSGCRKGNPNTPASLSGTVKYKGQLVKGGTLALYSKKGGAVNSITIRPDGTYSGTDLPEGEMEVTIETESLNPNKEKPEGYDKGMKMSPKPEGAGSDPGKGEYVKIPPKYADKTTSKLTVTLKSGENTQDFNLTDD
jgi:hypothetical protein